MELSAPESDDWHNNGHERMDDCIILKITLTFFNKNVDAVIAKIHFSRQVWFLICRENRASTVFE